MATCKVNMWSMVERVIRVFFRFMQWNSYCFGPLLRDYSLNEEYIKKIFFKYGTIIGSATFSISARIQSGQADLPALKCLIVFLRATFFFTKWARTGVGWCYGWHGKQHSALVLMTRYGWQGKQHSALVGVMDHKVKTTFSVGWCYVWQGKHNIQRWLVLCMSR